MREINWKRTFPGRKLLGNSIFPVVNNWAAIFSRTEVLCNYSVQENGPRAKIDIFYTAWQ